MRIKKKDVTILPATSERWGDLVTLFGPKGACGGCWCQEPRLTRSDYEKHKGAGNRRKLKALVDKGPRPPGLIAYLDDEPVGWVSVEPREAFGRLARSRVSAPVDDKPVWSIVCLLVRKDLRYRGLSVILIEGAVDWVREQGGRIVEAYPQEPRKDEIPHAFAWTGVLAGFEKAGFKEVLRRSPTRPIVRKSIRPRPKSR